MRRFMIAIMALSFAGTAVAQIETDWEKFQKDGVKDFERFKQDSYNEFESFRRQANKEYARFMEEAWKPFEVMEAEEIPRSPKPLELHVDDAPATHSKIDYDIVIESESERSLGSGSSSQSSSDIGQIDQPEPVSPIVPVFESDVALFMYGSSFPVRVEKSKESTYKLKDASEKSVAKMWKRLSCAYFDNIVAESLRQRKENNLCDWAYVKLTEKMANKYFEPGSNEAVVLQMYILTQSGYQMRMARTDNQLLLLMGSKEKIYRYKYSVMDDVQYYVIDRSMQDKSIYVYDRVFPNEKQLSLAMTQPKFNLEKTKARTFKANDYPELQVTIESNKNLLDFYDDYPVCGKWNYYSSASLSDVVKKNLYPTLEHAIEGKSELESVNILLNFVQTGFQYATDQEQFGYERPLYPDEMFYYPYCDCEDRSILFSCLVRELLGLDVVLLNYPCHLTTAVRFNEEVEGDYLEVEGDKYIICEPTFVKGAPAGCSGSEFKNLKPQVIRL